jgi:CRISPR-associated protein Cmr2
MHKREIGQAYCYQCMDIYQIKLYVLLDLLGLTANLRPNCLVSNWDELQDWWNRHQPLITAIARASDRLAFEQFCHDLGASNPGNVETRHPISGESQTITPLPEVPDLDLTPITELDAKAAFFWLWRFFPQQWAKRHNQALLHPADWRMPDCPLHSYINTVTAVAGAMFPQSDQPAHPHLLLFTFSPVQEFIKSSRKFLDFWAGSYMLHYLGAHLCWQIADQYGPDAVITPSLWDQEIIDAFLCRDFETFVRAFPGGLSPGKRFININGHSTSLVTAGFPNIITALVPSKEAAEKLGRHLQTALVSEWKRIGDNVREKIKKKFHEQHQRADALWGEMGEGFGAPDDANPYWIEFQKLLDPSKQGCWEWNPLWDAQLDHTWENYWVVLPLGSKTPSQDKTEGAFNPGWIEDQNTIARPRIELPSPAEQAAYEQLNVGTWWGSLQARLGQAIQSIKNTRISQIPAAPGERSTLSGQGSALHPRLCYRKLSNGKDFREGGGLPAGSMRLFWRLMAEVFPSCFNGSEKLNALELTKRLAWREGGVAEALGVNINLKHDYDKLIRFPNLSSIAAARFMHDDPQTTKQYHRELFKQLSTEMKRAYVRKAIRKCQVPKTDQRIHAELNRAHNGVIFSAKWLAEDLKLGETDKKDLYLAVEQTHRKVKLTNGSPADWWVLLKADGDGMGNYISGRKLEPYGHYILDQAATAILGQTGGKDLLDERKRMGPATHVGLNRALLDFSNRLVPYLAQQRCCGKVIYSGGDDVLVALPLADLPSFLLSLRAAWSGSPDPIDDPQVTFESQGGYWQPKFADPSHTCGLPNRPLFTMGKGATLSAGIVIAHKSVPLPTVLESIWAAEADRAKELLGGKEIPDKDGLCFRVIYGSGNMLEALMKGHLLPDWWQWMQAFCQKPDLVPILHRLAEELPQRAVITPNHRLFSAAARVILSRREKELKEPEKLLRWLDTWEDWALAANATNLTGPPALGTTPADLAAILRFSAFWASHSLLTPSAVNPPEPGAVGNEIR